MAIEIKKGPGSLPNGMVVVDTPETTSKAPGSSRKWGGVSVSALVSPRPHLVHEDVAHGVEQRVALQAAQEHPGRDREEPRAR